MRAQMVAPRLEFDALSLSGFRIVGRRGHPQGARHSMAPGLPLPIDLYCRLRHAAFRVVEDQPEVEDRFLARMGHSLQIVLSVPSFSAVWRAVAATEISGPDDCADYEFRP
jgi:hypothetical protein